MKPITFPSINAIYAENQPQYLPLPVWKGYNEAEEAVEIISCWQLSFWERIQVLFRGTLYLRVMTFDHPPQPILPQVENPFHRGKLK